jgi:rRNA processing protein Gar1
MGTFMHASEGEMVCTSTNVKIPYFNAPIYLENKTAVGKVDEILGPINQVYFTIKPQEGIVATSFKNGDKFFIGGDKLLPLERYISSPHANYRLYLTYPPDSCPSPSLLLVLLRSRSLLAEAVQEVDSVPHVVVEAVPEAVAPSVEEEAVSAEVVAIVDVADFLLVAVRAASAAVEVVVVVEATKCLASHLDTPKSAKHEGVNRQRRHGVMKGLRTAWEMVRKWRHCFVTLYRTILRSQEQEEQENCYNFTCFVHIVTSMVLDQCRIPSVNR